MGGLCTTGGSVTSPPVPVNLRWLYGGSVVRLPAFTSNSPSSLESAHFVIRMSSEDKVKSLSKHKLTFFKESCMILSGTGVREPPEQQPQGSSVFLGRVSFSAPGSHTPYGAGDLLCLLREVGGGRLFRRRRSRPSVPDSYPS